MIILGMEQTLKLNDNKNNILLNVPFNTVDFETENTWTGAATFAVHYRIGKLKRCGIPQNGE